MPYRLKPVKRRYDNNLSEASKNLLSCKGAQNVFLKITSYTLLIVHKSDVVVGDGRSVMGRRACYLLIMP